MLRIILNCFIKFVRLNKSGKELNDYSVVNQHYMRILEYYLGHHKGSLFLKCLQGTLTT